MQEVKQVDEDAFKWLAEKLDSFWSRSHFITHSKCHMLHNNNCESFNSRILDARSKTILPMLEGIRCILMNRMQRMREVMRAYQGPLCPNKHKKLEK